MRRSTHAHSYTGFDVAGPRVGVLNGLSSPLRQGISYEQFKRLLKTFLFAS